MAIPVHQHGQEEAIPVKMVASLHAQVEGTGRAQETADPQGKQQGQDPGSASAEEETRFEAEGKVSAGYMTLLKARILYVWKYPDDAVQKGQQGKVVIAFTLNSMGELLDIGIVRSSGFQELDSAVMDAIRKASPFGKIPDKSESDTPLKITGHFVYVLD